MLQKKDPSVLNLALLVALATTSQSSMYPCSKAVAASITTAPTLAQALAQRPTTFSLPTTGVTCTATGTPVRMNGSRMTTLNQALKQRFEARFSRTGSFATISARNSEGIAAAPGASSETTPAASPTATSEGISPATNDGIPAWLWWLLPLGLLGLLLWWLSSKRSSDSESTSIPPASTAPTPEADPSATTVSEIADPASRAESVINSDRAAINAGQNPEGTDVEPIEAGAAAGLANDRDLAFSEAPLPTNAPSIAESASLIQASEDLTPKTTSAEEPLMTFDVIEELDQLEAIVNEGDSELAMGGSSITLDSITSDLTEDAAFGEEAEFLIDSPTILDLTEGGISLSLPGMAAVVGGAVAVEGAGWALPTDDSSQSGVEATKFDVGQTDLSSETLATVDQDLSDLPEGYGESRIVLLPRDPQWAYAYWDVPIDHKMQLRQQGGQNLVLRLYDVTDVDLNAQSPHSLQQFDCDEVARDWYVSIPVSDRDYVVELGYLTADGRWLRLVRSAIVRIPPVYPSDWFEEQFATITWEEDLRGKTFLELVPPRSRADAVTSNPIYDRISDGVQRAEAQRVAGSLFGSMQQVPQQAVSSYVFPSGVGMWAVPTLSGIGMSGIGISGIGLAASMPPIRPRQFWLVADAELIVYGATEPDAKVTIAGQPIKLNPDGTFRFQMSFQDGLIDYPILAVAADDQQTRSIQMKFTRETPHRNTNTKDEATDEWF